MAEIQNGKPVNQGVKWLLMVITFVYSISFMPADEVFDNAKNNYRSSKGPQPMHLPSSSAFFQSLSNSLYNVFVGYGAFTKLFNKKAGDRMIIDAAISSYKEPYQTSSAWGLGNIVGILLRLFLLFLLFYKVSKM